MGTGIFQPKGLARIKKKAKSPKTTPSTTKITGDIFWTFMTDFIIDNTGQIIKFCGNFVLCELKYRT